MLEVYEAIKDMNPAQDLKPEVVETTAAASPKKQTTGKNASSKQQKKRFVGVRQRPSGRWVAEIKDSTQKLRLWLGTFDNAEDAARAYDDAARALRGANTRTNFKAPPNGSARLSRATRLLLQRVAMRSQENVARGGGNKISDKSSKYNQQPYQSLHQGLGAADPPYSASASASSLGFQQQPTSRTKNVVYSRIQRHQDHEFGFQGYKQPQLDALADPSGCAAFDEHQTMLPGTSTADAQLPDDSDPPSQDYVLKSCAVWSASQSPIYKVCSSAHHHQVSASAAAAYSIDSCDCEPLISGPSICGSESPIILSSNDGGGTSNAVSPKLSSSAPTDTTTSNSAESFWSYFDQALCAVS